MNACSNCGYDFKDFTSLPPYCPNCGNTTSKSESITSANDKKCQNCGHTNLHEAKYCVSCGTDLRELLMED